MSSETNMSNAHAAGLNASAARHGVGVHANGKTPLPQKGRPVRTRNALRPDRRLLVTPAVRRDRSNPIRRNIDAPEDSRANGIFLALLLGAALTVWSLRHAGKLFVIRVSPGRVKLVKGKPPGRFLEECRQIIRRKKIYGTIAGVMDSGEIRLEFSRGVGEDFRQRFRNVLPYEAHQRKERCSPGDDPKHKRASP